MAERLTFKVLTPTRELFSREVDAANVVSTAGEMGVLPGHAALLAELRPGAASLEIDGKVEFFALGDGFLEVGDDMVTALVRSAESASEIDLPRAEKRRDELEEALKNTHLSDAEFRRNELSLLKQFSRIEAANQS